MIWKKTTLNVKGAEIQCQFKPNEHVGRISANSVLTREFSPKNKPTIDMEREIKAYLVAWPRGTTTAHRFEDDGIAVFHTAKEAQAFASGYTKTRDDVMKVFPCTITYELPTPHNR